MPVKTEAWKSLVAGHWVSGDGVLDICNPYTRQTVAQVSTVSVRQVDEAVSAAKRFRSTLTGFERYEILHQAARRVAAERDRLARLITDEAGTAIRTSQMEVDRAVGTLTWSAEEAKRITGQVIPADGVPAGAGRWAMAVREPVGVVAAITPFNHPLNTVVHKLGPALAANNRVVLKPSEKTPLSALALGEILLEAGLPGPMLSILVGGAAAVGEALVQHPGVDMVTFTGSQEVGEHIHRLTGIKKVCLELGGNDCLIILDDGDLDAAVEAAVWGAFGNAGQRCTSVKRLLVTDTISEPFLKRFVDQARKLVTGDPYDAKTDIGPLINESAANRIETLIAQAVRDGARVLLGGSRVGSCIPPTILDRVPPTTRLVVEETFGPVAPVIRVRDMEEAIQVANASHFGLQCGVFTQRLDRAMALIQRLEVGGVVINESPGFRIDYLPFGGIKKSGIGREGVRSAIEEMTHVKTVLWDARVRENL